ncbi:hypothetical protein HPB47_016476 [Ixodes persulcatus]|uniref:Uncharacterized protein n=1 Tax=Ixodes persulcatus TaxID=34615 RepID=A0AC60QTA8_IXOPE|nr:hypothetical protein HPB47_016476 [Ixodes persulcatus]
MRLVYFRPNSDKRLNMIQEFPEGLPPGGSPQHYRECLGAHEGSHGAASSSQATADGLWRFVLEEWEKPRSERNFVSALFSSLSARMRAVVDARVEMTSY